MPETVTQGDELRMTIAACLDLEKPKSFFLYAGAGSGKTRAVIEAMAHLSAPAMARSSGSPARKLLS